MYAKRYKTSCVAVDDSLHTACSAGRHIDGSARRVLLRSFPYAAYFVITAGRLEVVAVLHQHRAPDIWRARVTPQP